MEILTGSSNLKKIPIVIVLQVLFAVANCFADGAQYADPLLRQAKEYEIKAVYLYKFLLFVQWPELKTANIEKEPASNPEKNVIRIGIVGEDPFGESFKEVEGKLIKSKKKRLVIKRFGRFKSRLDLTECDLLFVCASEKKVLHKILAKVRGKPILTVGDTAGFLEAGMMINLVKVGNKIRWEINRGPAKQGGLKISSQLLRNALRVVEAPKADKKSDQEGGVK